MKQVTWTITENTPLTPDTYRLRLTGDTDAITAPGQFVNLKLSGFYLRRPISVCDWEPGAATLIYKVLGHGTAAMTRLPAGTELDVLTGLGNGYDTSLAGERPLLVGGGVGIPPMYGLARRLTAEHRQVTAVLGYNRASDIFLVEELHALGVIGGLAALPVGAGQRKAQLAAAESLALHLILGGGHQLLVLGGELGDAGLQLLAAGVEPLVQRQQAAQLGAEGLIHRRSVGTLCYGHGQRLRIQRLQSGQGLLQLPLIKLVSDIVEGPDEGDALAESYLLLEGIPLPHHLQQLLRTLGVLGPLGQGVIPGLKGLYIGAGIGKIGKFPVVIHDQSSLG